MVDVFRWERWKWSMCSGERDGNGRCVQVRVMEMVDVFRWERWKWSTCSGERDGNGRWVQVRDGNGRYVHVREMEMVDGFRWDNLLLFIRRHWIHITKLVSLVNSAFLQDTLQFKCKVNVHNCTVLLTSWNIGWFLLEFCFHTTWNK